MSLRRFLNLVTLNRQCCIYSICRMDMSRQHLFYPATPAEQKKLNLQDMKSIQIPPPNVSFKPNPSPCADDGEKMYCFGLSENKLICTDQSGLSFLYDARLDSSLIMPSLRGPKWCPISFSIPDPDEQEGGGGRLYIMEKSLRPCPDKEGRFEAFVYTKPDELCFEKIWCHHLLPLPPFVLEPGYKSTWICSHGVLGSGSHLCMSFKGIGTYCFNTETREWSHAGDWVLPLHGKAEYLPDLNLWFGFSEDRVPCVSDLSSALKGEKPELCSVSGYDYCPPDWKPLGLPQVVSLGSSRLCILDYFQTMLEDTCNWTGELVVDEKFAVLTGVELLACGNGNGNGAVTGSGKGKGLCMINHKSGIFRSGRTATIEAVL